MHGPDEFTATIVRDWLGRIGARTLFIEPGSPWENGYCEFFNAKLCDELLDREIFYSLKEAQVLIERWRQLYNTTRLHSALGYRSRAPAAVAPGTPDPACALVGLRPGRRPPSGVLIDIFRT